MRVLDTRTGAVALKAGGGAFANGTIRSYMLRNVSFDGQRIPTSAVALAVWEENEAHRISVCFL